MIVKRIKTFAFPSQTPENNNLQQEVTSRDLQVENMKLQRQMMINNRMKQKLIMDERKAQMNNLQQIQRNENQKDKVDRENQVRVQKMNNSSQLNPADRNWGLVKQKSKVTPPVPMKN